MDAATSDQQLDLIFGALANSTRRAILAHLAKSEATVGELAAPFEMTLPAVSKHVRVLERAGLIAQGRQAQFRPCTLEVGPLDEVSQWVDHNRRLWAQRFEQMDDYIQQLQQGH